MKGLIIKDFYLFVSTSKSMLLLVAVFAIIFAFYPNDFFIIYIVICIGSIVQSLYSYDEKSGWDKYALTLPYSRTQLVSSKYIFGLLMIVPVDVILVLVTLFHYGSSKMYMLGILMLLSFVPSAFTLPFFFKLGAEKGRITYIIVVLLMAVIAGMVFYADGFNSDFGGKAEEFIMSNYDIAVRFTIISCFAGVLIYALSWLLSIRFYKQREV